MGETAYTKETARMVNPGEKDGHDAASADSDGAIPEQDAGALLNEALYVIGKQLRLLRMLDRIFKQSEAYALQSYAKVLAQIVKDQKDAADAEGEIEALLQEAMKFPQIREQLEKMQAGGRVQ